jgi:hypothetical protein
MSHLLYFWRGDNYQTDLDAGIAFHLNQRSATLHQAAIGEHVWAFTRTPDRRYVLAADLVVTALTRNVAGHAYGGYRAWGDLVHSRYFAAAGQQDVSPLLRGLGIRTGRPDEPIGRAFQGERAVRVISAAAHHRLGAYASELALEPRAQLCPEPVLESIVADPADPGIASLLQIARHHLAVWRVAEFGSDALRTTFRDAAQLLRERYQGRCQLTGWDPRRDLGLDLCEVHHVRWLSRGGSPTLENMVLVAPNLHRHIHAVDAAFCAVERGFWLGDRWMPLHLDQHAVQP